MDKQKPERFNKEIEDVIHLDLPSKLATATLRIVFPYQTKHKVRGKWSLPFTLFALTAYCVSFSLIFKYMISECKTSTMTFDGTMEDESIKRSVVNSEVKYCKTVYLDTFYQSWYPCTIGLSKDSQSCDRFYTIRSDFVVFTSIPCEYSINDYNLNNEIIVYNDYDYYCNTTLFNATQWSLWYSVGYERSAKNCWDSAQFGSTILVYGVSCPTVSSSLINTFNYCSIIGVLVALLYLLVYIHFKHGNILSFNNWVITLQDALDDNKVVPVDSSHLADDALVKSN